MSWRDLLAERDESRIFPWLGPGSLGGRSLRLGERTWSIAGPCPVEEGWYQFSCGGNRRSRLVGPADPTPEVLRCMVTGYLVGDHLVLDGARVELDPTRVAMGTERVHLIEPGLDRFVRVSAGRLFEGGPLIYRWREFPSGIEEAVMEAYLDEKESLDAIKGVTPALEASFRMEVHQRTEARKRRAEVERQHREEEARRAAEERRQELVRKLGDGAGRRQMAGVDFAEAARAALAVGGAVYLDHRRAVERNEMVVRFRLGTRRFECTCDETLQVIDSGICLTAHDDDQGFEAGTKGDRFFTLESLPSVIEEAIREGKLVVYRHVD